MFPLQSITTMTISIILLSIITTTNSTAANYQNSMDRTIQIARNQYYRACVWKKTKVASLTGKSARLRDIMAEIKDRMKTGSTRIYNSAMFSCCDSQITYYGLSQETREIIEQLIGLNF